MSPIDLLAFQRITTTHGTVAGAVYFDAEESSVHDVFSDRIVFQSNYADNRSYEVDIADGRLRVRLQRLNNYPRGHKAQVIDDDMDEEDCAGLGSMWQRLSQDLDTQAQNPQLDSAATLTDLFHELFDEASAQTLIEHFPAPTGQWDWAWSQVASALAQANQLAQFEWKMLASEASVPSRLQSLEFAR